jgi:uncharacterized surface protein with fasciclin (FAS1) repeats
MEIMKVQSYLSKVVSLTCLVGVMAVAALPATAETSKKVSADSKPAATSTKPASTVKPTAMPAKPAAENSTVSETTTAPIKPTVAKPAPTVAKPAASETVSGTTAPAKPAAEAPPASETVPTAKPSSSEQPATPAQPSDTEKPAAAEATTVVGMVDSSNSFKTLAAAIKAADLNGTLSGKGPFTLFAPTDGAFAALPKGTVENLMKPENKDKLVKVLTYHVISSEASTSSLKPGKVTSVEGSAIDVKSSGKELTVNDAKVLKADVKASNGIIHVIDKVMLPPDM